MNLYNKCLKEGNPIIEALGDGFQSILIRTYKPAPTGKSFLLFPTSFYKSLKTVHVFKEEYVDYVNENIVPIQEGSKIKIKYYATVEYVIENKDIPISYFNDFHIWTDLHVYDYLGDKPVYIWLVRVYKLKNPVLVEKAGGNIYANLKENVSLDLMKPVISDSEFMKIKDKIVSTEYDKLLNDKLDKILENQEKFME